ncbi:putative MFS multidrug transporter [Wallemia mellicola]|uniref:Putative MFS multidrug transporter n=1 Tax=Wallemia mellicola TaxID=1708541 RepID=A0A4T0PPI5_9BASI|nr:putative MFS multidrug transporter [Wallemia mellicola]TIC12078.1 putative MFS multidrug transporter [Wallemia mellicola]TIC23937.1 putative MFS multidrug transporter [Wallemia mellicola]
MTKVHPVEERKPHEDSTLTESSQAYFDKTSADGKIELTEDAAPEVLGYSWSTAKKWYILSVIVVIQISMNLNASIYANSVEGMTEEWGISAQAARVGQCVFLVAYGFGCEFFWALMCSLAPNFGTMVVGRFLGGLSSAGGSVTLGLVADFYNVDTHQYAIAYVVWSSCSGSVVGAIVGGFIHSFSTWRWVFWIQLIFGGFAQAIHWAIPETRSSVLLDREAKRRRKEAAKEGKELNIWGPGEIRPYKFNLKETAIIWMRPFEMFVREPIVLSCSLLSGFSDMLIFIFLESYGAVLSQWGFKPWASGLGFVPILIGYFIGWFSFFPTFRSQTIRRKQDPFSVSPENRLWWLLWTAPLLPIGMLMFAWTSLEERGIHWIGVMISSAVVAIANYNIYLATVDYMVAAYGPYSSSATGGNALARDVLAGISAMFATPFYSHFPNYTLELPTTILACIAVVLIIPVFLLYFYGPQVRNKSKFAQLLAENRETSHLKSQIPEIAKTNRATSYQMTSIKRLIQITEKGLRVNNKNISWPLIRDADLSGLHPSTTQKTWATTNVPFESKPLEANIDEKAQTLNVKWNYAEGFPERSTYSIKTLSDAFSSDPWKTFPPHTPAAEPWTTEEFKQSSQTYDLAEMHKSPSVLLKALTQLHQRGLIFVKNVQTEEKTDAGCGLRAMIEGLFGEIRNTFYGQTWDVRALGGQSRNVAYTGLDLKYHMDLLYFESPPRFQFLHSLKALPREQSPQGHSLFLDSYRAAEELSKESYDLLKSVPLVYEYHNDNHHYIHAHPVLEEQTGKLRSVNYSPPFQSPYQPYIAELDEDRQIAYLKALREWDGILERDHLNFELRLNEGECVVFDNRRVLHARRAFDEQGDKDMSASEKLEEFRKQGVRRSQETYTLSKQIYGTRHERTLADDRWAFYEQYAISALDVGDHLLAEELLLRLAEKFPQSPRVSALEGMLLESKGEFRLAERLYTSLLEEDPTNIVGLYYY